MTVAPNIPLLRGTLDQILAQPELHGQEMWAKKTDCGTSMCFAGWACVLSGLHLDGDLLETWGEVSVLDDGRLIPDAARRVLRIDRATSDRLFYERNDVTTLKDYVDQIAEHGRIVSVTCCAPCNDGEHADDGTDPICPCCHQNVASS